MNSGTDFAGMRGSTTMKRGASAMRATGAMSRMKS
jgi:hypothetical protein